MDNRFDRIETKIDKLSEQQAEMNTILAKQHEQISYHIRRTNLLEDQMKPVVEHVDGIKFLIKILGVGAAVAGILKLFL